MTQTPDNNKIRILIVDNHPLFRQGLKHAFQETPDMVVCGEAENGDHVVETVQTGEFDVVLLDIAMPGKNSLEVLREIRSQKPDLAVLILSMHPEEQYAVRFIRSGASGYLTKESAPGLLLDAVRKVARGGKFASRAVLEKLAFHPKELNPTPHLKLSQREFEVFCKISEGLTLGEIASQLSLSIKTISTHRSRILDKMGMNSNAELIHYALDRSLVKNFTPPNPAE
ncbi:MAG: DNA-binding response regulator [Nitrospinae bacterium CG11_big_fil_rev_8_21_14_0_20_56_8]|nr:MAG: DNA-binding response regulator [Nitrospinae bacterium CG11_big_fil_rev_8_21_14_0_20_56_8]